MPRKKKGKEDPASAAKAADAAAVAAVDKAPSSEKGEEPFKLIAGAGFLGELPVKKAVVAEDSATPIVQEVDATPEVEVEELNAPTAPGELEMIDVISRSRQWEPFQRILILPGVPTPVRLTSWIQSQLDAKVLRRG